MVTFFGVRTYSNDSVKLIIEYLYLRRNKSVIKYMAALSIAVFSPSTCPLKSLRKT